MMSSKTPEELRNNKRDLFSVMDLYKKNISILESSISKDAVEVAKLITAHSRGVNRLWRNIKSINKELGLPDFDNRY